jgi:predicted ATP-grasp superfamily ATP-dependent carboligase
MSAAAVLNVFCKIENIPLSTEKLVKEGLAIENKLRDLMKNAKDAKERYTKIEGSSGPTYR